MQERKDDSKCWWGSRPRSWRMGALFGSISHRLCHQTVVLSTETCVKARGEHLEHKLFQKKPALTRVQDPALFLTRDLDMWPDSKINEFPGGVKAGSKGSHGETKSRTCWERNVRGKVWESCPHSIRFLGSFLALSAVFGTESRPKTILVYVIAVCKRRSTALLYSFWLRSERSVGEVSKCLFQIGGHKTE